MIKVTKLAAEKLAVIFAKAKKPEAAMLRVAFGGYG